MSDNIVSLDDIKHMREELNKANVQIDEREDMLIYRDNNGIPQVAVVGEYITQQQLDNMPDEIRAMIITEE